MEIESTNNRRANVKTLLCVLTLVLLFALLLWRVPFGYDWTDEQYFSEIGYRLIQGDRPLVDTWEVHQFSAMLAAPVLKGYLALNGGSTDGMVLFLRYFYVSFQLCVSLVAFFVLKRKSGRIPALLVATMLLAYSHFSINSYFYDSMTQLYTVLSGLMCIAFFNRTSRGFVFAALGGASFALAIVAFPYVLLVVPICLVYWLVRLRDKNERRRNALGMLAFFAGAAAVALALVLFLLSRASVSQLLTGVRNMLGDPDHQSVSLVEVMGQYFNAIRVIFSPASYGAAALLLLGIAYTRSRKATVRRLLHRAGAIGALLLLLCVVGIAMFYDWDGVHRINLFAMGFALVAPGLFFLTDRRKDDGTMLLYWLGCGLSISVQLGSNTRILASSGMLLPASLATMLYLFDHANELFAWDAEEVGFVPSRSKRWPVVLCGVAILACAACVLGTAHLRLTAVHRDEPVPELTVTIQSGAAKGIRTTPKSAELHDRLIENIRENAPSSGAILITYLFPEGYLVTGLRAATPSAFNMSMDSSWLAQYYEQHPERVPALVFALDPAMPFNELGYVGISTYAENPSYVQRQYDTGTAFMNTTP
ncbi:MAG: hypothetical protein VB091_02635 [Christensenella sp.]|nr:hypothetical protein [Christensenella sp.]